MSFGVFTLAESAVFNLAQLNGVAVQSANIVQVNCVRVSFEVVVAEVFDARKHPIDLALCGEEGVPGFFVRCGGAAVGHGGFPGLGAWSTCAQFRSMGGSGQINSKQYQCDRVCILQNRRLRGRDCSNHSGLYRGRFGKSARPGGRGIVRLMRRLLQSADLR